MNLTWWCSAQTGPWSWAPQAYPGIWLFMLAILAAYGLALRGRGAAREATGERPVTGRQRLWFLLGWLLLWVAFDWPLGPLGAGYLLSAHMLQYVLIIWFVAPLLESGIPGWMRDAALAPRALAPLRWVAGRPAVAFALFNLVLVGTHLPVVADTLKPLQLGSMAIDLLWLGSALLFWISTTPRPGSESLDRVYGRRLLYIVGIKILPIMLGAFFVLSDFPLFRTFELAPRVFDLSAKGDQVIAGWLMWMGTTPLLVYRIGAAFFAWHALDAHQARPL